MLDNIKAVIFDLDGTLVDSMNVWKEIDNELIGSCGVEVPKDFQKSIEGMGFKETMQYIIDRFDFKMTVEEMSAEVNRLALIQYSTKIPLKDGAYDFLKYLHEHDIKTGIATSNGKDILQCCLAHHQIGQLFDVTKIACEVNRGKPFPDIYLAVASELEVKPEECLVFEDIPNGITAGKSAGMKVCAIYDKYSEDRTETIKSLADYYITSFSQVTSNQFEVLSH